jgi:hypothetical protein
MQTEPFENWTLKDTPGKGKGRKWQQPQNFSDPEDAEKPDDDVIRCRSCLYVITKPSDSISIGGGHYHAFANPYGIVFEIGCFKNAIGCRYVGIPTDEFTWFSGYHWRVAVCGGCTEHLGWFFSSTGGDSFNGLIMNRLILPE